MNRMMWRRDERWGSCGYARCLVVVGMVWTCLTSSGSARADDRFPLRQQPIDYFGESTDNVVAALAAKLERGEARLVYDETSPQGYLRSLLGLLDVPVESQVLNFTAAARNAQHVRYEQPRAIYFSDEATVGYVPGTPELELTAFDPQRGTVFYTLRQLASETPRIEREDNCLQCHVSPATTRGVAGLILSSLVVSPDGKSSKLVPLSRNLAPIDRFGAWFVTGDRGPGLHRGNDRLASTAWSAARAASAERDSPVTLPVELPAGRYPTLESDIAALLALSHLVEVHNLSTRLRYESLLGRPTEATEDRLARELLGADEAPVDGRATHDAFAPSGFRMWFESRGVIDPTADANGSLHALDLHTRLFRHRLSPFRLSRVVESLPRDIQARLDRRIELVLRGREDAAPFDAWPESERTATRKAWRSAIERRSKTPAANAE